MCLLNRKKICGSSLHLDLNSAVVLIGYQKHSNNANHPTDALEMIQKKFQNFSHEYIVYFLRFYFLQRKLVEMMCSVFVASWTGVVKYHGPRPSMRPQQVQKMSIPFSNGFVFSSHTNTNFNQL